MVRHSERGSVAGFVIGGIVLLGLLAGAIYVVRNKTPQAADIAQTTTNKPAVQSPDSSTATDTTTDTTSDANSDLKAALAKQAEEEKKAQEQQKAQQSESAPQTTTPTTTPTTSTAPAEPSSHLPTTGPEEAIFPAIGATLLVGVGVAFQRSRALL